MKDIAIRPAQPEDGEAIRALIFSVFDEFEIEPQPKGADSDLDDIGAHYEGGVFVVAEDASGDIVGTVGLARRDSQTAELRKLYIAGRYRGRGLGKRLLRIVLEAARDKHFSRIVLVKKRVMDAAAGLFLQAGFTTSESSPDDRRGDVMMVLDITAPHEDAA